MVSGVMVSGAMASWVLPVGAFALASSGALAFGVMTSGTVASGPVASGTVASGTVASGAGASGALVSGPRRFYLTSGLRRFSLASGVMVSIAVISETFFYTLVSATPWFMVSSFLTCPGFFRRMACGALASGQASGSQTIGAKSSDAGLSASVTSVRWFRCPAV
jgi:hypothetical protein